MILCNLIAVWAVVTYMSPVNFLTNVGYLLEVFIRLWIPSMVRIFTSVWSYSTGNLSQGFIDTFSVVSRPWTHPLISEC